MAGLEFHGKVFLSARLPPWCIGATKVVHPAGFSDIDPALHRLWKRRFDIFKEQNV